MNHCIPDRELIPKNAPRSEGLVITEPMGGKVINYVWRERDDTLFEMPSHFFKCRDSKLKQTEQLRRETPLEFGDNIVFTCGDGNQIQDYEKSGKQNTKARFESKCVDGKYMVRTVCVIQGKKPRRCWTKSFGFIDIGQAEKIIRQQAIPDVALFCWIEIGIKFDNNNRAMMYRNFAEFDSVAQDDRMLVDEAEWNIGKNVAPKSWDDTDDEDFEDFVEKDDAQLLGIGVRMPLYNALVTGMYVHTYFGLITDTLNCLRTVPISSDPPETVDVFIQDLGDKRFARFDICDLPPVTEEMVSKEEELREPIEAEGFVLNQFSGRVYSSTFPSAKFYFGTSDRFDTIPTGTWVHFMSRYHPEHGCHEIFYCEVMVEKPPLDCGQKLCEQCDTAKLCKHNPFEFKIDAEFHQIYKQLLHNRMYGFINDPDNQFVRKKKYRKYDIIVKECCKKDSFDKLTLFELQRMAKPNEILSDAGRNHRRVRKHDDPFCDLDDIVDGRDEDGAPISQVEYNSLHSKRERELIARARKKERDRAAKEVQMATLRG
ncbi:hypothetical protein Ddc_08188 [Ditylenchus destructor]|nr:hypothetical protein Ddc_08188 [Ditylenchus destructor]